MLAAAAPLLALVVPWLVLVAVLLAEVVSVAVEVVCEVDDALVALSSSDAGKPPAWAAVPMATIEPTSMYVHGRRILNDPLTIMSLGRVFQETCAKQTRSLPKPLATLLCILRWQYGNYQQKIAQIEADV